MRINFKSTQLQIIAALMVIALAVAYYYKDCIKAYLVPSSNKLRFIAGNNMGIGAQKIIEDFDEFENLDLEKVLSVGMECEEVELLQQLINRQLRVNDYGEDNTPALAVDGVFGPKTEAALMVTFGASSTSIYAYANSTKDGNDNVSFELSDAEKKRLEGKIIEGGGIDGPEIIKVTEPPVSPIEEEFVIGQSIETDRFGRELNDPNYNKVSSIDLYEGEGMTIAVQV